MLDFYVNMLRITVFIASAALGAVITLSVVVANLRKRVKTLEKYISEVHKW